MNMLHTCGRAGSDKHASAACAHTHTYKPHVRARAIGKTRTDACRGLVVFLLPLFLCGVSEDLRLDRLQQLAYYSNLIILFVYYY